MKTWQYARRAPRAFSLLELMLVLAILGILMAVAAWNLAATGDKAKIRATTVTLETIRQQLAAYNLEKNGYPPNLVALTTAGFLDPSKKLVDGWDQPLIYMTPGLNGRPYELLSAGPDKQPSTPDDIDVWTMQQTQE